MLISLLLVQAVAAQAGNAPDIQLQARVRARSLTIQKRGDASLTLHTDPDGGNILDVQAPKANGRKTIRNVDVTLNAEARIGDPQNIRIGAETSQPQ